MRRSQLRVRMNRIARLIRESCKERGRARDSHLLSEAVAALRGGHCSQCLPRHLPFRVLCEASRSIPVGEQCPDFAEGPCP